MATYNYIHHQTYFNMTIPKTVLDVVNTFQHGECGKFHFICEQVSLPDSEDGPLKAKSSLAVRSKLLVKMLPDGSWNITNSEAYEDNTQPVKKIFIVESSPKTNEDSLPTKSPTKSPIKSPTKSPEVKRKPAESQTPAPKRAKVVMDASDFVTQEPIVPSVDESQHSDGNDYTHIEDEDALEEEELIKLQDIKQEHSDEPGLHDHDYIAGEVETELSSDKKTDDDDNDVAVLSVVTTKKTKEGTQVKKSDMKIEVATLSDYEKACQDGTVSLAKTRKIFRQRVYNKNSPPCPFCGSLAKDAYNLVKHMKRLHGDRERLAEEIDKLKPEMQQKCDKCGHMFANRKSLLEHLQNVHQDFQGLKCPQCPKEYRTKAHLNSHIKTIHLRGDKKFQCDQCSKMCKSKRVLRIHTMYYHAKLDRIYQCDQCSYKYAFQKQYYEHKTRVHGPKKEVCKYCGYKCSTKWYMQKHESKCNRTKQKREFSAADAYGLMTVPRGFTTDTSLNADIIEVTVNPGEAVIPSEVSEALVEIEHQEEEEPERSLPVVEVPMWQMPLGGAFDAVETTTIDDAGIEVHEQEEKQEFVLVEEGESYQQYEQYAIVAPDGSHQLIQLVIPGDQS